MSMFGFVCKKVMFFEKAVENASLIMPRFAHRANRDSKSETKTTIGLVSTPRIQWKYQNLKMSFR